MKRFIMALICVGLFVSGCGTDSYLGKTRDNFTAYYNTYYNAEVIFQKGVESLEGSNEKINRDLYLSIFDGSQLGNNRSSEFEEVVKKCADLLRNHPESKWVNNALLLIGKSYYYQQNYIGAEEKFAEIVALNDELSEEATFWLIRALIGSKKYDQAEQVITESTQKSFQDIRWINRINLAKGEMAVRQQDWPAATIALEDGLSRLRDNDLASRAQFVLGQVYQTQNLHDKAADSFDKVQNYNPIYELSYVAQIEELSALSGSGNFSDAAKKVRKMGRDDKNFGHRVEVALLSAQILQAGGQFDDAENAYFDILYGNQPPGNMRGRTHYALGTLYRDAWQDFASAGVHFDTSASNLRANYAEDVLLTSNAITDAKTISQTFSELVKVRLRIERQDSLLTLGQLDEAAFEIAIEKIRVLKQKEYDAEQAEILRQQTAGSFNNAGQQTGSQNSRSSGNQDEFGFLLYKSATHVQSALNDFKLAWGDRPLANNWRRLAGISLVSDPTSGDAGQNTDLAQNAANGRQVELNLSEIPRTPDAIRSMKSERAAAYYELGNVMFLSLSLPDSAAAWYRKSIEDGENGAVAKRAVFALAEVQLSLGDTTSAHQLYRRVLDTDASSEYAVLVRERLGLPADNSFSAQDSTSLAQEAYATARLSWLEKDFEPAWNGMLTVIKDFPNEPATPKALLAASEIFLAGQQAQKTRITIDFPPAYHQQLINSNIATDSTNTNLVDLYKYIESTYPTTPWTIEARTKRLALEEFQEKWQAESDSLSALQNPLTDLAADTTGLEVATSEFANPTLNYTWVLMSDTSKSSIDAFVAELSAGGYDVKIIEDKRESATRYRVTLGQYGQAEDAATGTNSLPEGIEGAWVTNIQAIWYPEETVAVTTSDAEQAILQEATAPSIATNNTLNGTFTWITDSPKQSFEAANQVKNDLEAKGYESYILFDQSDATGRFRIGVGQFKTAQEAQEDVFMQTLPDNPWLLKLGETWIIVTSADQVKDPLKGEEKINLSAGGFSWVLGSSYKLTEVRPLSVLFSARGFRVAIIADQTDEGERYRCIMGHFLSNDIAESSRNQLPNGIPDDIWVLSLDPDTMKVIELP